MPASRLPERVVVLNDAGRALGGATSLALASALGARQTGLEVAFITAEGDIDSRLAEAGIRVVQIPGERISAGNRLGTAAAGLWRKATVNVIRGEIERFDTPRTAYHLHNWQHFLSPSAFLALKPVSDRLLISTHDQFLACPNGAQYNFQTERACGLKGGSVACGLTNCDRRSPVDKAWRYVRHLLRSSAFDLRRVRTRILLLHETQRDIFIRAGVSPDRLHVVRNPAEAFVQSERVTAESNNEALFVGRMSFEKGADLAARAAAEAGVPMRFLGDGPLRAQLADQFPSMAFEGHVGRAALSAAAKRARLLVLPSRWPEPFGLVLPEALWSGLPVICSSNAYLAPEIARLDVGRIVDPRDTRAFAACLGELFADNSLMKSMSERAFSTTGAIALTMIQWQSALLDLYAQAIAAA